jgi:hypothetical protein
MQVHVFDRLAYLQERGFPEAEFMGWGAQEAPWAPYLEGRLVFTGHGSSVWNKKGDEVSKHIVRIDPSGHHLNAFRLRVGWIHLPLPFLGCTSHPSIHKISTSEEMAPWTLGNQYDRPIPRRLVEEAGVERQQFGMKKRAAGLWLDTEGLQASMTQATFEDYLSYYHTHWTFWMTIKRGFFRLLRELYPRHKAFNERLTAFLQARLGVHVHLPVLIPRELRITRYGNLGILSLLVHWSTEKIIPAYAVDRMKPQQDRAHDRLDDHVLAAAGGQIEVPKEHHLP